MPERLTLISADGHVGPPVADYRPYIDREHLDDFDRYVPAREAWRVERNRSMGLDPDAELVDALFGEAMVAMFCEQEAVRSGGRTGVYDSARRTAELESQGIVAEVVFPDFQNSNEPPWGAAFPYPDTTPQLRRAGARAYNRWLADFCAELPGRRAGVAVVQPHDVEDAVREIAWARSAGLASIMLPTGDLELESYNNPRFDPVWKASVDHDLPITFHSGGSPWEGYGHEAMWVSKVEFRWWARRPLWQLIFGGVFERFPELRVCFTEQGADWIPSMLAQLDAQYGSPFERGVPSILSLTPSGYWNRNCYVGASFMSRAEVTIRDDIGVDRILWGADYPHIEGTWPHTEFALHDAFNGCTLDEVRRMTCTNAAAVYGFDVAYLDGLAAGIGPAADEILSPSGEPAVTYSEIDYVLGRVGAMETARRFKATLLRQSNA